MDKLIKINTHKNIYIFNLNDVCLIKAQGAYAEFYLKDGTIFKSSKSLGFYKKIFKTSSFPNFSRSYIINLDEIVRIEKKTDLLESTIILKNKIEIPLSSKIILALMVYINAKVQFEF